MEGSKGSITSLVFKSDGKFLYSAGYDGTIRIWNIDTGALIKEINADSDKLFSLAISTDEKMLVSGGSDKNVNIWSIDTGTKIKTLIGHELGIA